MKILLTGVAENYGGTESVIHTLIQGLKNKYVFEILAATTSTVAYDEDFRKWGVKINYLNGIFGLKSVLKRKKLIKELLINRRIDLVHINAPNINASYIVDVANELNIPVIYHIHNAKNSGMGILPAVLSQVFKKYNEKKILNNSNELITVSQDVATSWFGKSSDKVRIIMNGVAANQLVYSKVDRINLRDQLHIELTDKVIVMVARLEPIKNYPRALEILSQIIPKYFDYVIIVGEGSQRKVLEEFVDDFPNFIKNRVLFLGVRTDIGALLSASDVFLTTSFSEGLCVSVIEAQASGLPSVVSTGVPKSVDVTGNVSFISLEEPNEIWMIELEKSINKEIDRVNANEKVDRSYLSDKTFLKDIDNIYHKYNLTKE